MSNNKINLLPNKNFNNSDKPESKKPKPRKNEFVMHIPRQEEDEDNQSFDENEDKE